ncbi:MAG: discoidin domain-containing protein, partial [Planctomycetota bacterium]|nr:discoidin domain-containing protein [Planctomycetota bacterium]
TAKAAGTEPVAPQPALVKPTGPVDDPSKAAPGPELANLISKALVLSAESKFREAAEVFKLPPAKLEKFDSFDRDLTKMHADAYTGLAEMKTQILERLKADPNKVDASKVLARAPGGKLAGGDEKELSIKDKQASFTWKWEKLSFDELQTLSTLALGSVPPNAALGLGVMAYDQNTDPMDAFARKTLAGTAAGTGRRILDLIDLRDKVVIAKKQAVQTAYVEKLLFEMNEAMTDGKFAVALAKGTQLRSKYADSDALKAHKAEVDATLEVAKLATETGAVPQPGNVALASSGAKALGPEGAELLIDGNSTRYTGGNGFATVNPGGEWVVALPKVYLLREIRMLLWDIDAERYYQYQIEVSYDGTKYAMVADHSKDQCRSWQVIKFPLRPVKTIKIRGLYDSTPNGFNVVELEAYCIPPDKPPVSARAGTAATPVPPVPPVPPRPPPKVPPPPPKKGEG